MVGAFLFITGLSDFRVVVRTKDEAGARQAVKESISIQVERTGDTFSYYYKVFTDRPDLFGKRGTSKLHLGDVSFTLHHLSELGAFGEFQEWCRKHGGKDSDRAVCGSDFCPFSNVYWKDAERKGGGGAVLDLVLKDMRETGVGWVFCQTEDGQMRELMRSRGFVSLNPRTGYYWAKQLSPMPYIQE